MLVRLLLGSLGICPAVVAGGVGWYQPAAGVAVAGVLYGAVCVFLLLADVFPEPKAREVSR